MIFYRNFASLMFCVFFLAACQHKTTEQEEIIPAQTLYEQGISELEAENYKKAADYFERIFFQHPGHIISAEAKLMQSYALYLAGEYEEAGDILDIFVKLHPRHKDVAYAYYMKALASYVQISNVDLDQSKTRETKEAFQELINRFPRSKYAIDAKLKMDLVNDHLAGKEMNIGRYYLQDQNPIAAISRFQTVIQQYDTTAHIQEALYRMVESSLMLGLKDEAEKYANLLAYNYPKGEWTDLSNNLLKQAGEQADVAKSIY